MPLPKLLIFASGSKTGGGSGFEKLVEAARNGILKADIVGVVSNRPEGGVREKAIRLGVPFIHFAEPWDADSYQRIAHESEADFFALSGWLKLVRGLDLRTRFSPKTVFNIHPGPLPEFGGDKMYGHYVHEAVMTAYKEGRVNSSAVSMHFVTEKYDEGPIFWKIPVPIDPTDDPKSLGQKVNAVEHTWQALITNEVVSGNIRWDGQNPGSLVSPSSHKSPGSGKK